MLLAWPLSLHATSSPALCWRSIKLQNLICGAKKSLGPFSSIHIFLFENCWRSCLFSCFISLLIIDLEITGAGSNHPWKICIFFHRVLILSWLSEPNQSQWADNVRGRHLSSFKSCILFSFPSSEYKLEWQHAF